MIKAVLFDFDGTLADSSAGIFETAKAVMHDMGYEGDWPESQLRKFVGPPLRDCFSITFGMEEENLDEAVLRYKAIYRKTGYLQCKVYDGIVPLLKWLRERNIKVGVATNKEQDTAHRCISNLGLNDFFDGIFGTDEKGTLKKPDIIALSFEAFGVRPDEVLMVGDTENDREGAENTGTSFVGVTWGFGYSYPLNGVNIEHVNRPEEIKSIIEKINGGAKMIEKIETKNAPAAIGPYSQAVKVGNFLFASGQIPVDPATGLVVEGSTADQARQCFKNIKAVLAEAGTDITKVVKATVFLKDMNDFVPVNEVYAEAFSSSPVLPARSAVQVAKLPKDVGVEIEVIAII